MNTYEKISGDQTYRNYTEENVGSAMTAINNSIWENLAATTFQTPRNTLPNEFIGKHTHSENRHTILTYEKELLIPKTLRVVAD